MSPRAALCLFFAVVTIAGCESLPKPPHHVQYGIYPRVQPPGFYGVDNETHEHVYRPFDDPAMSGGQALTAHDYKSFQEYYEQIKQIAERRCK